MCEEALKRRPMVYRPRVMVSAKERAGCLMIVAVAAILGVGLVLSSRVEPSRALEIAAEWPSETNANVWQVAAISSDGLRVVSGSSHEALTLWDPGTGAPVHRDRNAAPGVRAVAFSPDGLSVLTLNDKTLELLDCRTAASRPVEGGVPPRSVAFLSGGRYLRGDRNGAIEIRELLTGESTFAAQVHAGPVRFVAPVLDAVHVLSVGADGTMTLTELRFGAPIWSLPGAAQAADDAFDVTVSPDGTVVATADLAGTITLRDTAIGAVRRVLPGTQRLKNVAFSPDGHRIAAATGTNDVLLLDATTGAVTGDLPLPERAIHPHEVVFFPDGKSLLVATWGPIYRLAVRPEDAR
jgi:WD40 repeat protein